MATSPSTRKSSTKAKSSGNSKAQTPPPNRKTKTRGFEVISWIETHCVHTNGRWIGQPFKLLPWQKRLILELFEVEWNAATRRWLRRYRWALLGVPKKNGKTELAAALGLYFLIGSGEPAPLVVCSAAGDDQADLVFGAAKTMCEMSPTLQAITEPYEKEILVPSIPGAKLKRVAAVAGTNDGQNIYVVICDELHEWVQPKHEQTWNVLTGTSGARLEPMVLQITTAGYDEDTVLGRQYALGKRVRDDSTIDPRFYFYWIEAEQDAPYDDPATWESANPSYGVLVFEDFYRDQLTKKTEATFRRYYLNQWTTSEEAWISAELWDACARPDLKLRRDLPLHVGIDVGLKHDSSAVVLAQLQGKDVVVRVHVWENPYPPEHSMHDSWRFDIVKVENLLVKIFADFPMPAAEVDEEPRPGPGFYYDPHFFERSAVLLEGQGLNMIEFPQYDSLMAPASQALFELVVQKRLAHDGDADLRRQALAAVAKETDRGWRIQRPKGQKGKRRKHIDAAIALAMSAWKAESIPIPQGRRKSKGFSTF